MRMQIYLICGLLLDFIPVYIPNYYVFISRYVYISNGVYVIIRNYILVHDATNITQ